MKWFTAVGVVVLWLSPAYAQKCETIEDVQTFVESVDGAMLDLIDVNGKGFDQIIVTDVYGAIIIGLSLNGCTVGVPVILGLSVPFVPA